MNGNVDRSIAEIIRQNIFQILGILVLVANLWLASKLSPLEQSLTRIDIKVQAIEHEVVDTVSKEEFDMVIQRLDRVQASIDKLVELHTR